MIDLNKPKSPTRYYYTQSAEVGKLTSDSRKWNWATWNFVKEKRFE